MERKMASLLGRCESVSEFEQLFTQIVTHGLYNGNLILPKLVTIASHLHSVHHAFRILTHSHAPNVVAYNALIKCSSSSSPSLPITLYTRMKASAVSPNSFTFTFLINAASRFLHFGRALHSDVFKFGLASSVFVQNSLVLLYGKCSQSAAVARHLFDEMPLRDTVSWNSMLSVYLDRRMFDEAFLLFHSMPTTNIVTFNTMIAGLSKAGYMDRAHSIFRSMPETNQVSWNCMISGYVKVGDMRNAQLLFDELPAKSIVSWTAIVSGYSTVGDLNSARAAFDLMPVRNVVSWNAMISGYVHNHKFDEALDVFHSMLLDSNCHPDQSTLISILSACSHLGSIEHGKWVSLFIQKNKIEISLPLANALIDMFSKCGDVQNAKEVFDKMQKRCVITWTTMISGLAVNGKCREALTMYEDMCLQELAPDDVIFLSVLSACVHGGLVEEGKSVYDQMIRTFEIKPRVEHYGCMVDLLSRAGKLDEAVDFIEKMHLEPNAVIWATLLSSCKIHGNGDLLESVTRKISAQEPSNPCYYTLVSNLSASLGLWDNALSSRVAMKNQKVEKQPGCSSIQVGNHLHEFLAKDISHKEREKIYTILNVLYLHLKED
uniref:Chlororespiratory reduction 4 n=1 Tax=Kalanchoe fedtschenkoi TaxID=63787 RepID=A0A7N0TZF0_KALFE